MYHFFSRDWPTAGVMVPPSSGVDSLTTASVTSSSGVARLPINKLRELSPGGVVDNAEHDRRDDRHDDHRERRRAHFLDRGPRDLLELAPDFVVKRAVLV